MTVQRVGYGRRLFAALLGREVRPAAGDVSPDAPADEQIAGLRALVATPELDLRERDRQIEEMRSEYATLEAARDRAAAGAGRGELEKLFKRMAGPLANLAALTAMADAGQQVLVEDLVSLIRGLQKELARTGLETIGTVGEQVPFEVGCHQRMSGGAVSAGTPVTVQLPGFRLGEKVLFKAMVSADRGAGEDG